MSVVPAHLAHSAYRKRETTMKIVTIKWLLSCMITLAWMAGSVVLADKQPIDNCNKLEVQQHLAHYNNTRLDLTKVLQQIADTQTMSDPARKLLLGYIDTLDNMRANLPEPDPDSSAFKNFDFTLGLTLTSVTLFLHDNDEQLTQRFMADRDNPNSELGQYLIRLDKSRTAYTDNLALYQETKCAT